MGGLNITGIMKIAIPSVLCVAFEKKKIYDYVCIIKKFSKIYLNENILSIQNYTGLSPCAFIKNRYLVSKLCEYVYT